jgi:tetratricopeptide (TPR) repeat protein
VQLAQILSEAGQTAAAEACLQRAVARDPGTPALYLQLGKLSQQLGRFGPATAAFERAIELQPDFAEAWLSLVSARKITAADQTLFERITACLDGDRLTDHNRARLHYGLGKAHDDLGDYAAAMRHFDQANAICAKRLRMSGRAIDRRRHAANVDRLIATFTREFFAHHAALGTASELPILVIGMIRSGTTLTEQIMSSHAAIGAAGELRFWGERGVLIGDIVSGLLNPPSARRLAEKYCALLRGLAPGALRVIDKMPTNFLLLGLIHLIFPRARIIHCRRNPVDTCLSIYTTPYSNLPDFAHERSNIVFYYREYLRLMEHWRNVLPADCMLDVDYEELIADRQAVARRIMAFCGLPWDDACLRHESNERAVRTPSQWQARQPIYRSSVARWRHYEPWLGGFGTLIAADGRMESGPAAGCSGHPAGNPSN